MYRYPPHYQPQAQVKAVSEALITRLQKVVVGDPAQEGVKMGSLVNNDQRQDVQDNVNRLVEAGCEVLLGGKADLSTAGAFFPPTLLFCPQPDEIAAVHAIEAFGPVATLMPYQNTGHAMTLARAGEGSLAGTLVTASGELARVYPRCGPRPRAYSGAERRVLGGIDRSRLSAATAGPRRAWTCRRR